MPFLPPNQQRQSTEGNDSAWERNVPVPAPQQRGARGPHHACPLSLSSGSLCLAPTSQRLRLQSRIKLCDLIDVQNVSTPLRVRVSFVRICDCRIFRRLPHFSHIVHIAYFPHKLAFSTAISILFVSLLGRPISVRFCYQSLLVGCRSELQPLVALLCSTVCCNIA